jgi:hypothetical protein
MCLCLGPIASFWVCSVSRSVRPQRLTDRIRPHVPTDAGVLLCGWRLPGMT